MWMIAAPPLEVRTGWFDPTREADRVCGVPPSGQEPPRTVALAMLGTAAAVALVTLVARRWIARLDLVAAAMVPLWSAVPKGFLPTDDTGRLRVSTEGAEGTSFEAMVKAQRAAAALIAAHPAVEELVTNVGGRGGLTGSGFIKLHDRHEREHVDVVVQQLRGQLSRVPELRVFLVNPPPIRIGAQQSRAQYQFTLQADELEALLFGWRIVKHVKSNAIVFTSRDQTVGIGGLMREDVQMAMRLLYLSAYNGVADYIFTRDA